MRDTIKMPVFSLICCSETARIVPVGTEGRLHTSPNEKSRTRGELLWIAGQLDLGLFFLGLSYLV